VPSTEDPAFSPTIILSNQNDSEGYTKKIPTIVLQRNQHLSYALMRKAFRRIGCRKNDFMTN
jgi:hypothetical protein